MQLQTKQKAEYGKQELISCGNGNLFGRNSPKLPLPPLLMFDRVTQISSDGGNYNKGFACAELDIKPGLWFFDCHFEGDPLMPGCFSIEGLWQLTGFYMAWLGLQGRGRVIESGSTRFLHTIEKDVSVIEYQIHIRRMLERKNTSTAGGKIAIADGIILNQGTEVCRTQKLMIGLSEYSSAPETTVTKTTATSASQSNLLLT